VHITAGTGKVAARCDARDHNRRDEQAFLFVLLSNRRSFSLMVKDGCTGNNKSRIGGYDPDSLTEGIGDSAIKRITVLRSSWFHSRYHDNHPFFSGNRLIIL
jgi:hypothetical protein